MDLLKSPLYSKYVESDAKLVNFAGWEMPISFSGLIKEHESVKSATNYLMSKRLRPIMRRRTLYYERCN